MSQQLDQLTPVLMNLEAADVGRPAIPIAVYLQEAHDMLTFTSDPEVRTALLAVGLSPAVFDNGAEAIAATQQAQSQWTMVRRSRQPENLPTVREEAQSLRSLVVASIRWNLRSNRTAQAAVDVIVEGDSDADLVQDLHDLAALVTANADAFADDQTFDAAVTAQLARDRSVELRALLSDRASDETERDAVDLRNRAYTHLNSLMTEIRTAGRYAFRDDTDALRRFGSVYARRKRAEQRSATAEPEPSSAD